MRGERYQIILILLGLIITALLARFVYHEIFPEYKIYQNNYIALEEFRSNYSGEPPPVFSLGVKQIVFEREDRGPERIDRCISCHVAEQLPHFSPTKIAYDVNGQMMRDADGTPVKIPNENYVWARLDQKIAELTDEKVNQQLEKENNWSQLKARQQEAEELAALKVAKVGDQTYDVTKVLQMHPLIGKETRPFEFHNVDEYGCTSCHSGNGRGLTTEKAHGPVFDNQYEIEHEGPTPRFTETDEANDPKFSKVFNHKPSDALLFQTSPILVGGLIQASCVQCHEQSSVALQGLADTAGSLVSNRQRDIKAMKKALEDEKLAVIALVIMKESIKKIGLERTKTLISEALNNPSTSPKEQTILSARLAYLKDFKDQKQALNVIDEQLIGIFGSKKLADLYFKGASEIKDRGQFTDQFIDEHHSDKEAKGSLFDKWDAQNLEDALLSHLEETRQSFADAAANQSAIRAMESDIDLLTRNYRHGRQLYLSQACYACHKIAGTARGGIGPELTHAGKNYPWFIKESIVWPQADLRTSTMPNFMLDHVEIEDLMTYLLAQKGPTKTISEAEYKIAIQEWEAGKKMPWEKQISPSEIHDLRYSMTVFATEGCAACHRLKGFESDVGYTVEKQNDVNFNTLYRESSWFQSLIPEEISGTSLVKVLDEHGSEINEHLSDNVRKGSILEEISEKYPDTIEALYSNFRYASRAKNELYQQQITSASDPKEKKKAKEKLLQWQELVHRVLMMYIQEYGLGRLIGPRPNWAGIYRSDEWLMEHFRNPSGHVPRSIMPIMPFDDSKFYALTYMLNALGKKNRDAVQKIWENSGFNPSQAFNIFCAQCHGEFMQGNGPVSTWIYPIPKNLRNAEFLRNLTKENAIDSIKHGVKGTPMPPWGETPKDKNNYDGIPVLNQEQIIKLVNWMYFSLPGSTVIRGVQDVPKWFYSPKDVIEELHREGGKLNTEPTEPALPSPLSLLPTGDQYYAATEPQVTKKPLEDKENELFDVVRDPIRGEGHEAYYIKKKFYTQDNIDKGHQFFMLNCVVCHGSEADGSGIRASIMFDAKPRMLTNLNWIQMRDDLRLLRSIKFGVPGTAMTPWGDLTTSQQRIQLVIFIRSLSADKKRRESLMEALYKSFDRINQQVEKVRFAGYSDLEMLKKEYAEVSEKQKAAKRLVQTGKNDNKQTLSLYQEQLETLKQLNKYQALDDKLYELRTLIFKEKDIYQNIGYDMLSANVDDSIWDLYLKIIPLVAQHFFIEDDQLKMQPENFQKEEVEALANKIVDQINRDIKKLENEQIAVEGKLPSTEKDDLLRNIRVQMDKNIKIRARLLSGIKESYSIKEQEAAIFNQYVEEKKALKREYTNF